MWTFEKIAKDDRIKFGTVVKITLGIDNATRQIINKSEKHITTMNNYEVVSRFTNESALKYVKFFNDGKEVIENDLD
jgi:hypothetical protein